MGWFAAADVYFLPVLVAPRIAWFAAALLPSVPCLPLAVSTAGPRSLCLPLIKVCVLGHSGRLPLEVCIISTSAESPFPNRSQVLYTRCFPGVLFGPMPATALLHFAGDAVYHLPSSVAVCHVHWGSQGHPLPCKYCPVCCSFISDCTLVAVGQEGNLGRFLYWSSRKEEMGSYVTVFLCVNLTEFWKDFADGGASSGDREGVEDRPCLGKISETSLAVGHSVSLMGFVVRFLSVDFVQWF